MQDTQYPIAGNADQMFVACGIDDDTSILGDDADIDLELMRQSPLLRDCLRRAEVDVDPLADQLSQRG